MTLRRVLTPHSVPIHWLPIALGLAALLAGQDDGNRKPGAGIRVVEKSLQPPAPIVPIEPDQLDRWQEIPGWLGLRCASCHREVARDWSTSAHGLAWVDKDYSASVRGKRRPESCRACHIPQPLLATGTLVSHVRARDHRDPKAHFGITCATCHLGPDGVVLGPWGLSVDEHESRQSPEHRSSADPKQALGEGAPGSEVGAARNSNALCSACHSTDIGPVIGVAKDFASAGKAAQGFSCVGCHMAPVERRWANRPAEDVAGDPQVDGENQGQVPLRWGRSHALQTPRDPNFLRLAFGWSLDQTGDARFLRLRNQAGHRVPGAVGRILSFTITGLSSTGEELGSETFRLDSSRYLPVDGLREFPLPSGATAVLVVGEHEDPRVDRAHEFLRLTLR